MTSPPRIDVAENKQKFMSICKNKINREGLDRLLDWLDNSDFFTAPASTKFHGNFVGGLCEHSLKVYETLSNLNNTYQASIPEDSIAVAALFHDVCKVNFYKPGLRNVKTDAGWTTKKVWEIDEAVPLGHGEKSCIILQWYMKLNIPEILAIRWHMGGFDSSVKGGDWSLSRAQTQTPLVTLLQVSDMIASSLLEVTIE